MDIDIGSQSRHSVSSPRCLGCYESRSYKCRVFILALPLALALDHECNTFCQILKYGTEYIHSKYYIPIIRRISRNNDLILSLGKSPRFQRFEYVQNLVKSLIRYPFLSTCDTPAYATEGRLHYRSRIYGVSLHPVLWRSSLPLPFRPFCALSFLS